MSIKENAKGVAATTPKATPNKARSNILMQDNNSTLRFLTAQSINVSSNFAYINWQELKGKIKTPLDLGSLTADQAKNKAPIVAANDAPNKQKETVLLHDNFTMLRLDLDETKLDIDSINDTLESIGFESFIIYATTRHQQQGLGNRYRVFIELAKSVCFAQWSILETYLCYVFEADDCSSRVQQIMYLPVRFKGDTYEHKITDGKAFAVDDSKLLTDAQAFADEQKKEQEKAKKSVPVKPSYKQPLIGTQVSIIDTINQAYSNWDSLLMDYGYIRQGRAYLPPESTTNKAGAYILTSNTDGRERYYSHHTSDPCATGKAIDQFDFITIRNYSGDSKEAIKDMAIKLFPKIDRHNKKEYAINKKNEQAKSVFANVEGV